MGLWWLPITENFLLWTFPRSKTRSFFESKSSWKDDIYWLLEVFCFKLFDDGKYGLFVGKKVYGKMLFNLSALFELSMIFQDLRNMFFCAVWDLGGIIELMFHDNEEWCKIWRGTNLPFQNWHEEMDKFWLEH